MITIRKIQSEDIATLKQACLLFFSGHCDETRISTYLDALNQAAFVAIEDNAVVGLCFGAVIERFYGKPNFYIHSIDVMPERQKRGIGTMLLSYVLNYYRNRGFQRVFLFTVKHNEAAMKLYERLNGEKKHPDDQQFIWNFE